MTYIDAFNAPQPYSLGQKPLIFPRTIIENSSFGVYTEVRDFAHLNGVELGDYSYMSEYTRIDNSLIGRFSNIASHIRINPGFHPYEKPCQHHFLYRRKMYGFGEDEKSYFHYRKVQKVCIGHDTWIGHGAVIMPSVRVGNGAIIGANTVVTKDVPPYAIVVGAGAKVIKYRFSKEIIVQLEKISWWDWSYEKIRECIDDFNDIREFIYEHR